MKIAIGADHAGFRLKEYLREHLLAGGHEVVDHGTHSAESTDYPDYAERVAGDVAAGRADTGLLVCSTGVGMSIAANKIRGVRAALGVNARQVALTRAHNNANVLTLGGSMTDEKTAAELVEIFLKTPFDGGRHARRVEKIMNLEATQAETGKGTR